MDTSEAILRQLRWIKWSAIVVAISFAAIAGSLVAMSLEFEKAIQEGPNETTFGDKALDLLEQGKEQDVLDLSLQRERTHPKDPNVFWYRAKAQYQLGQYKEALIALRKTEELAPTWYEESTQPLIKAIERQMGGRK